VISLIFLIFLSALPFLISYSWIDIRTKRLSNELIVIFGLVGLLLIILTSKPLIYSLISMFLMFILAIALWLFGTIGGADAKLIIVLSLFMPNINFLNTLHQFIIFLLCLGILGTSYGLYSRNRARKGQTRVPFIPVITLVYILTIFLMYLFNYL